MRIRRLHWFGHVERSSGTVRIACVIQIDDRRWAGRPKVTWKKPTENDCGEWNTPGRRQSKMPILSRNVDQKLLEAEFLIAKSLSKTLFLSILRQMAAENTVPIDF